MQKTKVSTHFVKTEKIIIETSKSAADSMKRGAEKSKATLIEGLLEPTDFLNEAKKDLGKSGKVKTKLCETDKDLKQNLAEVKKSGFLSKLGDKLSGKAKMPNNFFKETVDSTKTAFAEIKHEAKQKIEYLDNVTMEFLFKML